MKVGDKVLLTEEAMTIGRHAASYARLRSIGEIIKPCDVTVYDFDWVVRFPRHGRTPLNVNVAEKHLIPLSPSQAEIDETFASIGAAARRKSRR